jgi:serine/threonine protein kinase
MAIGQTFSHYELLEKLGEEVYLAQDTSHDRRVALRLLPADLGQREEAKKSAAALDHPFICKIYEIGEAEGRSFIAMEYVHGETLEKRLTEAPLPLAEAKHMASELAEALEIAHRKGLVHGDLKASNIVLTTGGHVKVLGFGMGHGEDDPRADILSLGEILDEMLEGSSDVPELLEHVVRKMLAARPEDRYQLVHEVRTDLEGVDIEVSTVLASESKRFPLGLAAVAALGLFAILVWWMRPSPGTLSGGDLSSVAVLPLRNVSEDPIESDYLAAGITEAVIAMVFA